MKSVAITLRAPTLDDQQAFLRAVRRSRQLHRPWSRPPVTAEDFRRNLDNMDPGTLMAHQYALQAAWVLPCSHALE